MGCFLGVSYATIFLKIKGVIACLCNDCANILTLMCVHMRIMCILVGLPMMHGGMHDLSGP